VAAKADYLRLANLRGVWGLAQDSASPVDASTCKVFSTEFYREAYRLLLEVVGSAGTLRDGTPGAVLGGEIEAAYRTVFLYGFSGGANEIQRDLIATLGLGMPRSPR
jgi:hypothetical protein